MGRAWSTERVPLISCYTVLLLISCSFVATAVEVQISHPKCLAMEQYQASYVATNYNITKHMGFYYEMAFRDLYPGPPMCDCQHTTKSINLDSSANYHEWFNFQCGPSPGSKQAHPMIVQNLITLNSSTSSGSGASPPINKKVNPVAVYSQTIVKSIGMNIPKWMESSFSTAVIAFQENKDDQDAQYDWVIEFTCGGLNLFFPGGFVGINMYSRTLSEDHLTQMIDVTKQLNLSWVLDKGFHQPTHNQTTCTYNTSSMKNNDSDESVMDDIVANNTATDNVREVWNEQNLTVAEYTALGVAQVHGLPNPICMAVHCGKQLLACELERNMCAAGLSCTMACGTHNNTMACLYKCLNSYEDEAYSNFVRCAITDYHCMVPPPPSGQIPACQTLHLPSPRPTINMSSVLKGRWYIPVGLNPVIDCYDCQYGDWSTSSNQSTAVHFVFKVPQIQGGFRNRTLNETLQTNGLEKDVAFALVAHADGLDQQQNFTVLAAREDVLVLYWCASNNIHNLLDGVNVFTRSKQLPTNAIQFVEDAINNAGLNYSKLCHVDNTNCEY
jgi:hypothetical protein